MPTASRAVRLPFRAHPEHSDARADTAMQRFETAADPVVNWKKKIQAGHKSGKKAATKAKANANTSNF